ncbi:MAG: DUF924 family protein [Acetobacteraceae bacterium]|nr:DUF924 family protein [Acetobacteraceae bacterium]
MPAIAPRSRFGAAEVHDREWWVSGGIDRYGAYRHRDVIRRFGRFPYRNAVLGRVSTEAEIAFLVELDTNFAARHPAGQGYPCLIIAGGGFDHQMRDSRALLSLAVAFAHPWR